MKERQLKLTSAAGLPPRLTHSRLMTLSSCVLISAPWRMTGGSGLTVTVSVAYLDLTGATPGAAPTWHWNLDIRGETDTDLKMTFLTSRHPRA